MLAALAFATVSAVVFCILKLQRYETHSRQRRQAEIYAQNALEETIAQLVENPKFRSNVTVANSPGHPENAQGLVTFDQGQAWKSVNHFEEAGDEDVPEKTAHLWALGRFGGAEVKIEAALAMPAFPFAVASSGPIRTSGAFFAGTIDNPDHADVPIDSPDILKYLKQASLLSNGDSLALSGNPVHVTGDLVCAGLVDLGSGVKVDGQIRSHASKKPIPDLDFAKFDTAGKPLLLQLAPGSLRRNEPIKGYARCDGDLVVEGDLALEEAILYVDGSLTVRGRLSGKGALFATGKVVLETTALGALDQLALISGGDMTVLGRPGQRSKLVGLLASKGNLRLSDLTVVGAVVCAGSEDRELSMDNVNVLGNGAGLQFEFAMGWGSARTSYPVTLSVRYGGGTATVRLAKVDDGHGGKREALPADFVGRYDAAHPEAALLTESDFEVVLEDGSIQTLAAAGISLTLDELQAQLVGNLNAAAVNAASTSGNAYFGQGKLSLDLNKFLRVGDTLQVVYRRIH